MTLIDLEIKGQGHMKVITVRDTPSYGHAPTYQISLTYLERQNVMARTRKYYLKNNYLTLRSKVKVPRRSLRYATDHFMDKHPQSKYHWSISKDKYVMARKRKYYLRKQLFDLEVKDQGLTKAITVCKTPPHGHASTYLNDSI